MSAATERFLAHTGVTVPLIGGPMYPCSNPELVGAISAAGALGVLQPISLTYVHGHEYRAGIRLIKELAGGRPVGMNALIEASSRTYQARMEKWIDVALEEGVKFILTSLGNPRWVVERAHAAGAVVYHDATELKWGQKALQAGVDGLIGVNARAGGHAGGRSPEALLDELAPLGLPVVCAGGIGDAPTFARMLSLGYAAVQCGTRFIATTECKASPAYKQAILDAEPSDVVLTDRLTGVPVAVLNTPWVQSLGLHSGPVARFLLKHPRTKHWMRSWYAIRAAMRLKRSLHQDTPKDYWQAGKSVEGIEAVEPVANIVAQFRKAVMTV
ncbi:MAG TPA: nitronate monooxygenase [Gemmatimonadales bacterium]|nr:nitronate monooxygenase [Gemmatimonadales bacterium]